MSNYQSFKLSSFGLNPDFTPTTMSYLGKRRNPPPLPYRAPKQRSTAAMRQRLNYQGLIPRNPQIRSGGWANTARSLTTEKKVIDQNIANYNFVNTGVFELLNGCIPGSQNYNRIGRKISLRSLQIRGEIHANTVSTVAQDTSVRMVIVYDRQSNGAAPSLSNVIQSQDITGANSSTVFDMINLDNRDRFKIIRDMFFSMSFQNGVATQAVTGQPTLQCISEYIKLNNAETIYNAGTAGTIGDIQTGALYILFLSSASGYEFTGSFRVRFEDK